MKVRRSRDGLHFFDRHSGVNVLLDEVRVPPERWSRAPRYVSFALTNRCDLHCPFCFSPKRPASLGFEQVVSWAHELDRNGCLGVAFGGGEPTLYPRFPALCQNLVWTTELSISFTTHAHRFTPQLRDELTDAVHFIRVSMDGVRDTYERIRGRSFSRFLEQLQIVSDTATFGINYVVNDATIADLDEAADLALEAGATELLLLPEYPAFASHRFPRQAVRQWVSSNSSRVRLAISDTDATAGMPLADPFVHETGTAAYVHVSASGRVSRTSYRQDDAVAIRADKGILAAIADYEGVCS